MVKKLIKNKKGSSTVRTILVVVLALFLALEISGVYIMFRDALGKIDRKISVYEIHRQNRITELEQDFAKMMGLTVDYLLICKKRNLLRDSETRQIKEKQTELIKNLEKRHKLLEKKISQRKKIDLTEIRELKKANFYIINKTVSSAGSGSYIKLKSKYYILTCAHLIKQPLDVLYAVSDKGAYYPIKLVSMDKKTDLALLEIQEIQDIKPLKISKQTPKEGSEIIVIGNPANMEDVITEGVIAKVYPKGYLFTNLIYFGNSGGSVLYKGEIIGVSSQLRIHSNWTSVYVNYGYSSNLTAINEFVEKYLNKKGVK